MRRPARIRFAISAKNPEQAIQHAGWEWLGIQMLKDKHNASGTIAVAEPHCAA
jgi:hypothetical protein